MLKHIQF